MVKKVKKTVKSASKKPIIVKSNSFIESEKHIITIEPERILGIGISRKRMFEVTINFEHGKISLKLKEIFPPRYTDRTTN